MEGFGTIIPRPWEQSTWGPEGILPGARHMGETEEMVAARDRLRMQEHLARLQMQAQQQLAETEAGSRNNDGLMMRALRGEY